jgi:ribosomal-protein-alanine N-acetyltransferase
MMLAAESLGSSCWEIRGIPKAKSTGEDGCCIIGIKPAGAFPSGAKIARMNDLHIETPRLYLRSMHLPDLDDLLKIFGDPKVMASFDTAPFNREQMERWVQRNIAHQDVHGYGLFSVIFKSEGILIGDCGLERMEVEGQWSTELGYDFRSDYWNQGFATEAASAVRDYAFDTLGLSSLISLIRVGNAASRRVSEKIGMRFDAEITRNGIHYWKCSIDGRFKLQV